MLTAIREFFEQHIGAPADRSDPARAVALATAALMVEVAQLDGGTSPAERAAILRAVKEKFGLAADEADALLALASAEAREATGYFQFTSLINRSFTQEQRQRVVELLWRVAYADAELSAHEQHVVRRIADLLYVPHSAYIAAKLRAREAGGGPEEEPPQ
jgi:uncharacterized tellurite resistance protein B-like protein